MILLTPTLDLATSTLTLSIPATTSHPASSHTIPLAPPPSAPHHTTFKIWGSTFDGLEVGSPALLSALSAFMGKEVLLICKGDEPRAAGVVEEWRESPGVAEVYGGEEVPSMKWNDMCPVLVVTEASRRDVGNRIKEFAEDKGFAKERWEGKGDSLEIVRWRGNVVVEGVEEAWEEDGWGELRFEGADGNQVDWFVSSRCGRCMVSLLGTLATLSNKRKKKEAETLRIFSLQLPNVDPESGVRDKVVPGACFSRQTSRGGLNTPRNLQIKYFDHFVRTSGRLCPTRRHAIFLVPLSGPHRSRRATVLRGVRRPQTWS